MRKKTICALLFLAFLVGTIVTWKNGREKVVETTSIAKDVKDAEIKQIPVYYEEGMEDSCVDVVKRAFCFLPGESVRRFVDDGWKVEISRRALLSGDGEAPGLMTDAASKTLRIQANPKDGEDVLMKETLHALCHFLDHCNGDLSGRNDWRALYEKDPGDFPEGDMTGHRENDSLQAEAFAVSLTEYYLNPEQLKDAYPNLYGFFRREEGL